MNRLLTRHGAGGRLYRSSMLLVSQPPMSLTRSGANFTTRSFQGPSSIAIGDISAPLKAPASPHLVPRNGNTDELLGNLTEEEVSHLRWMLQKDRLGQDMFLLGPPGPDRRRLALLFCQMMQREVEFISLSRDTTESDLKQRREIEKGESYFTDQAPVRAALNGRILVIDGIEKAERNVLPTLNNLLENREMSLEDGRFLVSPQAWQRLSEHHGTTQDSLAVGAHTLVKVHEDFRVIALGLPSPPFPGKPLDPPLRSRFQAKFITPKKAVLPSQSDNVQEVSTNLASFQATYTMLHADSLTNAASSRLPPFPPHSVEGVMRQIAVFPDDAVAVGDVLHRSFPFTLMDDISRHIRQKLEHEARKQKKESSTSRWGAGWAGSFDAFSQSKNDGPKESKEDTHSLSDKVSQVLDTDLFQVLRGTSCYFDSVNPLRPAGVTRDQARQHAPEMFSSESSGYQLESISSQERGLSTIRFRSKATGEQIDVEAACGSNCSSMDSLAVQNCSIALTESFEALITRLLQDHSMNHHLCLVGDKGAGKSIATQSFAEILGYDTELIPLYADMSARDLLQKRAIDPDTGNTTWSDSPLVHSALSGKLCVLDGLHTLAGDVVSTLQRLCVDRELDLFNGNRLVSREKWNYLRENSFIDDSGRPVGAGENANKILPIHPSFRIFALSKEPSKGVMSPETVSSTSSNHIAWLHPEVLGMFRFHTLGDELPDQEKSAILSRQCRSLSESLISRLCTFNSFLKKNHSSSTRDQRESLSGLSLRQLIKLGKRCESHLKNSKSDSANLNIRDDVHSLLLTRFSPSSVKSSVDSALREAGFPTKRGSEQTDGTVVEINYSDAGDGSRTLRIGRVETNSLDRPTNPELVPHPHFYDIPQHKVHLMNMLADLNAGEKHLLLIGNQGTGKNMLADQMLHLLNGEREYMQLHRDSTVGALTLTPALVDGKLVWENSPLVRAVREGRTLVLDEADKAPTEVVSIVKSLIEDGQMLLADGRRIVDEGRYHTSEEEADIVPLHPQFRLWVLANRPGWPFLGNDFFRECGDIFSTHVIDNPDIESEVSLLQSYAPRLEKNILKRLASAFSKLREEHETGGISYPYSTREAVAVVKHMSCFETDNVSHALENVLAFDALDPHLRRKIVDIFAEEGFRVADSPQATFGFMRSLWDMRKGGDEDNGSKFWNLRSDDLRIQRFDNEGNPFQEYSPSSSTPPPIQSPKHGQVDDEEHIGGSTYAGGTGGSNTAGLGGRGGPYRLDKGHTVHQVSEEAKKDVPPEVQERAKQMAQDALKERLNEIKMSEGQMEMYTNLLDHVGAHIHALRNVLEAAEMKNEERVWKKNQLQGDLDDSKIVDGVTGEKNIYKRRVVEDVEEDLHSNNKVKLHFVLDVSGSMYRFNNQDGRLNRLLETSVMIMESFRGFEDRFDYCIVGHSGDAEKIPLVNYGSPPQNEKERLEILQTMVAHTQFCMPGDHTIEATRTAISEASALDAPSGDKFVFIVSDANLRRYNIPPEALAEEINRASNSFVDAYAVFIASIADEAHRVADALPTGR
eukprot:gb/GECG01009124.1/.p1 GENE.gb/GECG01009124.1/~~gb/GECG01009124.1/.p1  ORF type:complete len:1545 (+),score=216.25 gb/GECG01009124.1/:1-4635(+)